MRWRGRCGRVRHRHHGDPYNDERWSDMTAQPSAAEKGPGERLGYNSVEPLRVDLLHRTRWCAQLLAEMEPPAVGISVKLSAASGTPRIAAGRAPRGFSFERAWKSEFRSPSIALSSSIVSPARRARIPSTVAWRRAIIPPPRRPESGARSRRAPSVRILLRRERRGRDLARRRSAGSPAAGRRTSRRSVNSSMAGRSSSVLRPKWRRNSGVVP